MNDLKHSGEGAPVLLPRIAASIELIFSIVKFAVGLIVLLIVFFIAYSVISTALSGDKPFAGPEDNSVQTLTPGGEETAGTSKYVLSPEVEKLGESIDIDKINRAIDRHDVSVLAVVPVPGQDKNLARLFKRHNLVIANNGEALCEQAVKFDGLERAGCSISIFVSRKRGNGKYSDLAGFHATWFRGTHDKAFKPANGWAEHITYADEWIALGGMIDRMDRP
ncbi:hypothetical protein GTP58_30365 [Duganella sp. CY15W]|uniref:hypothetical protein n=1 Tax=Duganella sp. CY15W TaxID=2692172 RepID=UPI00136DD1C1|nr:hypothetical protein [Duganella sp. CY15W]MYM32645.1 hypothetical protein [Duganella sp. CY15W]